MRALLDANVLLSYLLSHPRPTPPTIVVRAALFESYTLLLPAGVIIECRDKSENKPYLVAKINPQHTDQLMEELGLVADPIPELKGPFPRIGNDRKDDYLFAHAVTGQADYLVSGDTEIQKVGRIGDVQIVSPANFLTILEQAGLIPVFTHDNDL